MKFILVLTFSLFGWFSLTSCSFFSPEYSKPQIDAPKMTRNNNRYESSPYNYAVEPWWKKLNDPVLNELIKDGLANNNQIQIAYGNILQAQAKLKEAKYSWLPTLALSGSGFVGNTWDTNINPQSSQMSNLFPSGGNTNINFSGYYGGFVPSYSLNVFSNINQTKKSEASLAYQQASKDSIKLSVIGQLSGTYFMLLGQRQELKLKQLNVKDLSDLKAVTVYQHNSGSIDNRLLFIYDQQIANNLADITKLENSIAKLENALQILINKNPAKFKTTANINNIMITGLIPTNLSSSILESRPDIQMAEFNLKMANANIGLARSMFFPTISLTGLVGGASVALSNLFNVGTGFWMAQAALSMPILNATSYEEIKVAKGGYYVAYYNYMNVVKSAFQDVDDSLTNLDKANKYLDYTLLSLKDMQRYYQNYLVQYRTGHIAKDELLNAKLSLNNAEIIVNQAKMNQLDAVVKVYQSLAYGYELYPQKNSKQL